MLPGIWLALTAAPLLAQTQPQDVILRAIEDEMARSRTLRIVNLEQPYYIEYAIHDGLSVSATASLGALIRANTQRYRLPRIQVRVGDYKFDNTDYLGTDFYSGTRYDVEQFPIEDSYAALRHQLWLATDVAYKAAVEAYSRKKSALRNITVSEDLPDFSKAEPVQSIEPVSTGYPDQEAWAGRVKRLSAVFLSYPAVRRSVVDFHGGTGTQYLVTSEGTRLRVQEGMVYLRVRAEAQAADGMLLRDAAVFHSLDAARMPPDAELERGTRQVADEITSLSAAPAGDSYTGPVLFEGTAAAQLFAEVLGRNLVVPRRPVMPPGRSFPFPSSELEGRLGSRILPETFDVVDDPTQVEWRGRLLFGHYQLDLEGVPARPLTLVEKGVLKTFLLTRQPVKGFDASNGRARLPGNFGHKAAGFGNLFVRSSQVVPAGELRQKLIALCRERNKPYGLIVRKTDFPSSASMEEARRVLAGLANGGSARPVSLPVLVYRLYPDGREELVRGLRFRGLNTRSLKDIVAAADDTVVFDFLDNTAPFALMNATSFVAETSVIAPSVLIDDLELEKLQDELPKLPLVPPPPLTAATAP